jgi:carbon-monoxide dehydrogenase medium subunit
MKPSRFEYARASSVGEAVAMLADAGGEARVLAGGQTLGPMLNMRLAAPTRLVDVGGIVALKHVEVRPDVLRVGACVTHAALEDRRDPSPLGRLLSFVASTIAFRAIRNRGTVGGSLAHADPAADWPAVMTLLEARIVVASAAGQRKVPMSQFMQGAFATAVAAGEVLEAIEIPMLSSATRWGYYKINRKTGEFPEATGGVVLDAERGRCRIVIGALDGAPMTMPDLADRVARGGAAAADLETVSLAVHALAPRLDEVDLQLHAVAVRRAILQALSS